MIISLIVAIAKNRVIGKNNQLIWHLPKDMKFFMDTTIHHPVIMGRKNFESIPEKYRPLKNRDNIIITRNRNYTAEGCAIVHSIEESIEYVNKNLKTNELFIIGGGEIYKKCLEMNVVDRMYITHIETAFDGDTFFPEINGKNWSTETIMKHAKDDKNPHDFNIVRYNKIN